MLDDLIDAQASVDWAVSQIPLLERKLAFWVERHPYGLEVEPDPESGRNFLVAYEMGAPDPILNAWVGATINAIRSSLDILATSLARRNKRHPNANTHFPIFRCIHDFIDPIDGIDRKNGSRQPI